MAKTIVFPPLQLNYSPIPVHTATVNPIGDYKVFPNPVAEQLQVQFPQNAQVEKAWISAQNGTRVMELKNASPSNAFYVAQLTPGLYYLHLSEPNRTLILPFVKL